jgi:D-arabinan exo alpha-(1,3)/(1,5)-arabinofuranosidase (non-reducing end)
MSHRGFILATALLSACAAAQVPSDLASPKDFVAGRASSTDPNLKNGDSRPIEPGGTVTVADIEGSGSLTHIWFTIAAQDPDHLRELVLRITWDNAKRPAVECPIGDFFAQGPGKYVEYRSAPVSVGGSMALNCYWPMPFNKHAKITVTNEGTGKVYALYFNIDYKLDRRQRDIRYFHTQYRNYFPAPKGSPLTICESNGRGHFVGTIVTVMANSDGWWGEGNDYWYVDGEKKPSISGTGSEDYFCGAWDFGHAFQTPFFGVTYYDNKDHGGEKRGIQNTVYRWHIQDPVPFTKSLLFQLEHGSSGGNEDRTPFTNHYTTVGLYYVDNPEGEGPALAPYAQRVPKLLDD